MKTRAYKRFFCILLTLLLGASILIPQLDSSTYAASLRKYTVKSSALQKGQQFTLTNMPYNNEASIISEYKGKELTVNCVQNFAYTPDGKYIFTIGESNTDNKKHGLLTRCKLPSKKGVTAKAECQQATVLANYGHSDVLAVTQDNLSKQVYNIWVSCSPGTNGLGRKITRLTYKVNSSGVGKITKTVYISGFEKTNVKNGKAGYFKDKVKPEWVQCAVDADSNQIVFQLNLPSGYSCAYLSYNFKKINSALNSLKDKGTFNLSTKPKWQLAHITCGLSPLCSYQSFAVKGKSLYIGGGNFGLGAQIYVINYKTYKDGKVTELSIKKKSALSEIITIDTVIKVDDASYNENYLEFEGLKVEKSGSKTYYYVSFNCAGPSLKDSTAIYRFSA